MYHSIPRLFLGATILAAAPVSVFGKQAVTDAEVAEGGRSAILIDTHNDVTSKTVDGYDIATPNLGGNTGLARMKSGHLGAEFFAVYVDGS